MPHGQLAFFAKFLATTGVFEPWVKLLGYRPNGLVTLNLRNMRWDGLILKYSLDWGNASLK